MKPHKHAELIKLWADGAEIEERYIDKDNQDFYDWVEFNGDWSYINNYEYRIKPEPKPDVAVFYVCNRIICKTVPYVFEREETYSNLKLTFDGETGELKSAEVLK